MNQDLLSAQHVRNVLYIKDSYNGITVLTLGKNHTNARFVIVVFQIKVVVKDIKKTTLQKHKYNLAWNIQIWVVAQNFSSGTNPHIHMFGLLLESRNI